jgi:hypothetical protein
VAGQGIVMNIVCTPLFIEQLKAILAPMAETNPQSAKSFKLYLDTILLNLPTKAKKYKPSIFFDDDNIRDIEHQGCTVPFYYDSGENTYIILGIIDNSSQS